MNRICEILNIETPIIQGPTNWTTNAEYVAAVSNAGALGVLGLNAGQKEPAATVEETIENMRQEIHKTKALTDKPFGINLCPGADYRTDPFTQPMIDLMVEEKVPAAVYVGDIQKYWVDILHSHGIKVIFRAPTPDAKNTKDALDAGVDILVATGFDEGGTVPVKVIGTFSIVPYIVDQVNGKVPVMAAGGIADARTAKAAIALGAEGLFVASALLLSKESPIAENIKEMAVKANADDLLFYRTDPAYYRSLPGPLPDKLLAMSDAGDSRAEIYKAQYGYIGMRNGMLFGDLENGYASFGLGISQIHKIETVAEIVRKLAEAIQ